MNTYNKIDFSGLTSIDDILTVAGLNFTVNNANYIECNGIVSSDTKGIVSSENHFFGTCKKNYQVIQPSESLQLSELLINNGFKIEKCYLHNSTIILKMNQIEKFKVQNIGDIYDTSIFFTSDFSGKRGNSYSFFMTRLSCINGAKSNKLDSEFTLKHFTNYKDKFVEVQNIIFNLKTFQSNINKDFNLMNERVISNTDIIKYVNNILNIDDSKKETSTKTINVKAEILDIYNNKADLKHLNTSVYRIFQSINDYYSNRMNFKNSKNDINIKETTLVYSNVLENNYNIAMEYVNN